VLDREPDGWEYMLLAGLLVQGVGAHEDEYRDHEARFSMRSDAVVRDAQDAVAFVQGEISAVRAIVDNWSELINGGALIRAIGEPGEPGDPARIRHVADRMTSAYVAMIAWAARIRGAVRPGEYDTALGLLARFADRPLKQYRSFVDEIVGVTDQIAETLARGETPAMHLTITLTLSIDEEVTEAFGDEMDRLSALVQ
jgi:hypothetical protein